MIIIKPEGSPPCAASEREFMRAISATPGVYVANFNLPNSPTPGSRTREVDGILFTSHGITTVEVKGIHARGELSTPRMDSWAVIDGDHKHVIPGRPHSQALTHSKYLATFLRESAINVGWVRAALALVAPNLTLPPSDLPYHLIDNVYVVHTTPDVVSVLESDYLATGMFREISIETVQAILAAFECYELAPTAEELAAQGFRTEAVIASDVEDLRAQVRAEFLAASTNLTVAVEADPETGATTSDDAPSEAPDGTPATTLAGDAAAPDAAEGEGAGRAAPTAILDEPTATEWSVTVERFSHVTTLDPELTEVGAVVNGVAVHKRLVSYARRHDLPLDTFAAIVTDPVEVLGDDDDEYQTFCGETHAVSVRTLDGLAMFYKPADLARAMRSGTIVDGVAMTARAVRSAANQMEISLEAVARIVNDAEERWWVSGTTNVAHARGDIVAVTAGPMGQVQYVQSRALAVHRSQPTPPPTPAPELAALTVGEFTIPVGVQNYCQSHSVSIDDVVAVLTDPVEVFSGFNDHVRVFRGETLAVLVGNEGLVLAILSPKQALEYRDGVVHSNVRISGRCVYLARRRGVELDALVAAVLEPTTIARALGTNESVYIGSERAVTVSDGDGVIVDFNSVRAARAMVERGTLVQVLLNGPDEASSRMGETTAKAEPVKVPASPAALAGPALVAACAARASAARNAQSDNGGTDAGPAAVAGPPTPALLARPRRP